MLAAAVIPFQVAGETEFFSRQLKENIVYIYIFLCRCMCSNVFQYYSKIYGSDADFRPTGSIFFQIQMSGRPDFFLNTVTVLGFARRNSVFFRLNDMHDFILLCQRRV